MCVEAGRVRELGAELCWTLHSDGTKEKMKQESDHPSISLGMFICSLNQKEKKTVYQMECQEHCVKEHLSETL